MAQQDARESRGLTRRQFLVRLAGAGLAAPAAMTLLAACNSGAAPAASAPTSAPAAAAPTSAPAAAAPTTAPAAAAPTSAPAAAATTAPAAAGATAGPAVASGDGDKSLRPIGDKPPIKFDNSPDSDLRDVDKAAAKVMVDAGKFKKNPPFTLGFSNASDSNSWAVLMHAQFDWEVGRWGTDVIKDVKYTDAQDKDEKQVADIEDLLSQNIDALILRPATAAAANAVVNRAIQQGLPVIVFDRKLTTPVTCFVESNHYSIGKKQTDWLLKELNGKGNIVALSGVAGAGPAIDRFQALDDTLKSGKFPDIKLLDHQFADWSPSKGKTVMQAIIQANPQIDGLWSDSGLQGSGAIEALQESGRKIPPSTGDDVNSYLKQLKTLNLRGAGISNPMWQSAVALDYTVRLLMGENIPSYVSVKNTEIYPENLDQYVRTDLPDDYWADVILPPNLLKKVLKLS